MENLTQLTDCKCRGCGHVVAHTDGTDLFFGVQKVPGEPLRVTWLCSDCFRPMEWVSDRKRKTVARTEKLV